jgi:ABC-type transporter Mla maintaining outer membrane lipid asymmetry ATPase subunit MlaF
MEAAEPLVQVRGLRFAYGRRAVLKGVDLDVPRGKVSAILGTSGSGKSTLLQIMGGLLKPARARCASAARTSTRSTAPASRRCAGAWG